MTQNALKTVEGSKYDDSKGCYVNKDVVGDAGDEAAIRKLLESVPGSNQMKVKKKKRSETCVCYGYTEEEDPMAKFNRLRREAEQ